MFLSFIVPVYNVEKYLGECLDSLLDQDIPHEEYEIICINDGSTDGSSAILEDYAQKYFNIRVIHQENSGVATARNVGLDAAMGDYIWFVDSDDIIRRKCLKKIYDFIQKKKCDRLVIGTYVFKERLSQKEQQHIKEGTLKVNSHYYDSIACGSVLSKIFMQANNCRFHYRDISHGEDSLFMFELMIHEPKCNVYDEPVYFYRTRPGSAQTSLDINIKRKQVYSYCRVTEILKCYYDRKCCNNQYVVNMLMSYLWDTIYYCLWLPSKNRREIISRLRKQGLFPMKTLAECTLKKSYKTTRTDFAGKLFDEIYINLHRTWGFVAMLFLQKVIRIKNRLSRYRIKGRTHINHVAKGVDNA